MASQVKDKYGERRQSLPQDFVFINTHTIAAATLTYSLSETTLFATGIDNLVGPTLQGRVYAVLFADTAGAINALIGAADGETIQFDVNWVNDQTLRYGDSTYTEIRAAETSETPSGFGQIICQVPMPERYIEKWSYTITLSANMDDALDGEDLKVGLVFR